MDITHYAVTLIETRLKKLEHTAIYEVDGRPNIYAGAVELARRDKYQFQWWAAWLLGAQTYQSKKGGDRGIDGKCLFSKRPLWPWADCYLRKGWREFLTPPWSAI